MQEESGNTFSLFRIRKKGYEKIPNANKKDKDSVIFSKSDRPYESFAQRIPTIKGTRITERGKAQNRT